MTQQNMASQPALFKKNDKPIVHIEDVLVRSPDVQTMPILVKVEGLPNKLNSHIPRTHLAEKNVSMPWVWPNHWKTGGCHEGSKTGSFQNKNE